MNTTCCSSRSCVNSEKYIYPVRIIRDTQIFNTLLVNGKQPISKPKDILLKAFKVYRPVKISCTLWNGQFYLRVL